MKKAIIIGATSGIGRELAKILSQNGYTLGLTGRRKNLLTSLKDELRTPTHIQQMDVANIEQTQTQLQNLITKLGGLDLLIINAGIGYTNHALNWESERKIIETNVTGFTAVANVGIQHFISQSSGHLVAISSIMALRGSRHATAYAASKAFISSYMQGLRQKVTHAGLPITITDIKPGFVKTPMTENVPMFWASSSQTAAKQIYSAIRARRSHAYITHRWRLIAWLLKTLPSPLYNRL